MPVDARSTPALASVTTVSFLTSIYSRLGTCPSFNDFAPDWSAADDGVALWYLSFSGQPTGNHQNSAGSAVAIGFQSLGSLPSFNATVSVTI